VATGIGQILAGSRLHHIGVAVADLDAAISTYRALGFGDADRFDVPEQGIRAAFFPLAQGAVELIQPTDAEDAIGRFMAKRGEGFHHAAYEVDDLASTLKHLAAEGIELIDFTPRVGGHGLMIAFVHPRACSGVLTELVEKARSRAGER
jgi:methylmalonyl-CoA/ethylmalonyl-CoA epimerase